MSRFGGSVTVDVNSDGINLYTGGGGHPKEMSSKELKFQHAEEKGNANWEKEHGNEQKAAEHLNNVKILSKEAKSRGLMGVNPFTHNRSDIGKKSHIR